MPSRRAVLTSLGSLGLVVLASGLAAAQPPTNTAQHIYALSDHLLYVAVPVTLLTEAVLFYAIWRFRDTDEPQPTQENLRLEISWTIATAVILLFVGLSAYVVMANPSVTTTPSESQQVVNSGDPVVVNVTGAQWFWTFEYPGENVTTQGSMVLPAGRPIVFRIQSADVIHSFFVPDLGLKRDAIPGQTNYLRTTVSTDSVGQSYSLYCAEYCGSGHSDMRSTVKIVSPSQYQQWLASQRGGANASGSGNTNGTTATPTTNSSSA